MDTREVPIKGFSSSSTELCHFDWQSTEVGGMQLHQAEAVGFNKGKEFNAERFLE